MLLRITVAVVVVVVGFCSWIDPSAADRLMVPRDYGVKLCGREFIRAVIFTCGGSRWKRSLDVHLDPFQRSEVYGDVTQGEDSQAAWQQNDAKATDGVAHPRLPPTTLADLLAAFGRDAGTPVRAQQLQLFPEELQLFPEELSDVERPRIPSSKRKRNFSLGVAGMCCNQGCTKNDIGHLC